ncbi:surface lipoprotein assembly modifier [Candidatus Entotheonella palauensis]|uniref:surface lipoprotein assembly modifier n=1 Tax=Candidatus Entotheonella palauensis TaxID=93172 RepID=UPI000B7FADCE|nr:surface lipoprotein assembly modifier [Candidatus Entotheonella palauensis]
MLDNDRFSDWVTLRSNATIQQTGALFATLSLRYRFSDYFNQFIPPDGRDVRDRDGRSVRAGFDQYLTFNKKRSYARLSYHYEVSRNDGSDWEYDSHHVGLGLHTPLRWGITLSLTGAFQRRDYLHVNSFSAAPLAVLTPKDDRPRLDDRLTGSIRLTRSLWRSLTLSAAYMHTRNRSNLSFFDYRRNIVTLALSGRY